MKFVAVDIGNTAIKSCVWSGGSSEWCGLPKRSLEEVAEDCRGAEAVAFSSTRSLSRSELALVEAEGWWEFNALRPLPIGLHYDSPSSLGPDRLAGAIGAWAAFPGEALLVADVGTALTLDVVSAQGAFEGGNISLGLSMRLRALHEFTSRLPKVDSMGEKVYFGRNTVDALRAGARWGVVNEIAGAFEMGRRRFGCSRILLSGGGAPFVLPDLREALGESVPVVFDCALVQKGLKLAYEFNYDKKF